MLKLKFVVDKDVLSRCILHRDLMPKNTANRLWEKYKQSYIALHKDPFSENIDENILKDLQNVSYFHKYLEKAINFKEKVQKQWNDNIETINQFLLKILKTNLEGKLTTAYIVDPLISTGKTKDSFSFVYSHLLGEEDELYNLIYLTHEALHAYFKQNKICFDHPFNESLVEYIADIEMVRFFTEGKQKYETHIENIAQKVRMYPYWNLYLNRSKEEINQIMKEDGIKYNIEKYEKFRKILSQMDIFQFAEFLKENNDILKKEKFKAFYELQ